SSSFTSLLFLLIIHPPPRSTLFPYTTLFRSLSDKRWVFTKKYLALRQDPANSEAQKLGMFNPNTWGAYVLNGEAFIKRAHANSGDRKSTRLNSKSRSDLVCRLLLEKKKKKKN